MCSDSKVTKSRNESIEDLTDTIVPATTDAERLVEEYTKLWNISDKKVIRFFFSTYQSIEVISKFKK